MSKEKIRKEFKPILLELHAAGAELILPNSGDGHKTLQEIEAAGPIKRQALEEWEPGHSFVVVMHAEGSNNNAEKYCQLLEQLRSAGVTVVAAEEEDHTKPFSELKARSPVATRILDEWKSRGNLYCGWANWDRNA